MRDRENIVVCHVFKYFDDLSSTTESFEKKVAARWLSLRMYQ